MKLFWGTNFYAVSIIVHPSHLMLQTCKDHGVNMPALYFYGTLIALPKYFMCLVWILSQHSNRMAKIPVINHL